VKKVAAILLIAILFFNWYGYRIVTYILTHNADRQLDVQLDNKDYEVSELIEVRVALNMPYLNENSDFERHYGEMEVNGRYYTYVERKVEDGYLILRCIPNTSEEKIKAAGNDFFKMSNGLAQDQQGKKQNNSFAKNFWSEYDGRENKFTIDVESHLINRSFHESAWILSSTCLSTPTQPPEYSGRI